MTDFDDQQRFEKFVGEFTEDEYERYIGDEPTTQNGKEVRTATDKQIDLALQFRTPASEIDEDKIESEQIYDNRDISARSEINVSGTRKDITIIDKSKTPQPETVVITPRQTQPAVVLPETIKPKEKKTFINRLKSLFGRFRRKKK